MSQKRSTHFTHNAIAVGMSIASIGLMLASSSASAAQSVEQVTMWESHSPSGPPGKSLAFLIKDFNATHPSVHIDLTVTKASHKALGALAAGDAPALAWISHYDGNFLAAHALLPLNRYLTATDKANIFSSVLHNGEVKGQHYRLQANAKISQLTYNKHIFREAGIARPPRTWAQLAHDASLIKQRVPGVIPLAWKDSSAHILPPFLANGGHIFTPGSNRKKVDFLSKPAFETFDYFRKLYKKKELIFAHGAQIRADFGAGELAIADGTSAGYQKILNAADGHFPVGVFAYPNGTTGHSANLIQGLGFVLMVQHSKAQDVAAGKFINWWFSPLVQAYWGTHSGYPPETKSGVAAISASYLSSHPGTAVSIKTLASPYTVARPLPTSYKEVQAVLDSAFFNAVTGSSTVKSALQKLQAQADQYLNGQSAL